MGKYDEDPGEREQDLPGGQPADRTLDNAERDRKIIEAAVKGMHIGEIALAFRLSYRQTSRILSDAARLVRSQTADIVAQKFHLQLERLDRLYRLVELELQAYEEYMLAVRAARGSGETLTPVKFDDRPFRVAVMICERQAKLLGMDRGAAYSPKDVSPTSWLSDAPIEQVVDYAKQLKMTIPTAFETE